MVKRLQLFVLPLISILLGYSAAKSADVDFQKQYEAAITKIFVSQQYKAIPIFRLNPLNPGDVVQIDNETIYLNHAMCYPHLDPQRLNIQPMIRGQRITLSAALAAKGALLHQEIAAVNANFGANLDNQMSVTVDPISNAQAPDIQTLLRFEAKPECHIITNLLNESTGKYIVAYAVLYGTVRFELTANFNDEIKIDAQSKLSQKISSVFGINDGSVQFSEESASFYISQSPGPLPVALVPAQYNLDELARITYYMQGARGKELETAVSDAISTDDPGKFKQLVALITGIFQKDGEANYGEQWAQRFFSGKQMITLDQLREQSQKNVDFDKIGSYEAAQQLSVP
jgi:hypothetical protein